MLNIDKYAYASRLKKKDPMQKLFFAVLTLGVCLWANSIPISILILLIMGTVIVGMGHISFKVFVRLMLIPIGFLTLGTATIAFNIGLNSEDFIFSFFVFEKYIGLSRNGAAQAIVIFFKALGAVACLYYLSLNTPMVDLLSAFKKLRCPSLIIELMSLIYRFIFVLMETAETMFTAQKSRLGYDRVSSGYRSMGMLVSSLFIRSYKKADILYTALEARGYEGELHVLEEPFEKSSADYVFIIIINLILVITTLLIRRYAGGLI